MEKNKARNIFCWITSLLFNFGSIFSWIGIIMLNSFDTQVIFMVRPIIHIVLGLYIAGGILYITNRIFDRSFNEEWKRHNKKIHTAAIMRIGSGLVSIYLIVSIFLFYKNR